jgi:hypothetical protein
MLTLRAATVVEVDLWPDAPPAAGGSPGAQRIAVRLTDEADAVRPAVADVALVGTAFVGDRVIVNAGSSEDHDGLAIVHVNLTRGLESAPAPAPAVKLASTSLEHAAAVVDAPELTTRPGAPVAVLIAHEQLAPLAWAFAQAAPQAQLGYVQCAGGALAGARSAAVGALRQAGLLAGHITAGAACGGEAEALTSAGALQHGLGALAWDAAVIGPGPGLAGSDERRAEAALALESAHAALALGAATMLVARLSQRAESETLGIARGTLSVLDLLLEPVTVALPAGVRSPVGSELRAGLGSVFGARGATPEGGELDAARPARIARHDWRRAGIDLAAFAAAAGETGADRRAIGRDPLFFGAALAAGGTLAQLVADSAREALESV